MCFGWEGSPSVCCGVGDDVKCSLGFACLCDVVGTFAKRHYILYCPPSVCFNIYIARAPLMWRDPLYRAQLHPIKQIYNCIGRAAQVGPCVRVVSAVAFSRWGFGIVVQTAASLGVAKFVWLPIRFEFSTLGGSRVWAPLAFLACG